MGVVNVTDDSFSDGGLFLDRDRAVEHGLALAAAGAAIIDVGGESTRPGATRIDAGVETARVLPVIKELAGQGITVSIDTMHAEVARAALENGARIVNDVSGGLADPAMAPLRRRCRGAVGADALALGRARTGRTRSPNTPTWSPTSAPNCWRSVDAAVAAGVDPAKLIIDPGLGFAKNAEHNWTLLRGAARVRRHRASRCWSARRASASSAPCSPIADGAPRPPDGRETATAVISALAAQHGVWGVRVHDVQASRRRAQGRRGMVRRAGAKRLGR